MSRILVTGGAGFIGSHLVDVLVTKGHHVTIIDNLSSGKRSNLNHHAVFIKLDIRNKGVEQVFKQVKPEFVYHLAAQKNLQYSKLHPIEDAETNIIGSLRVLSGCKKNGVKKVIFFSSAAVYGPSVPIPTKEHDSREPKSAYGIAKHTIEEYITNSGVPYMIFRPANVYGPRQDSSGEGGVVAIFCGLMIKGKSVTINNSGNQTRDFVFVDDVVRAALLCLGKGNNQIVNIATQKETSVKSLFSKINSMLGVHYKSQKGIIAQEQYKSCLCVSKARNVLGWKPLTDLAPGLIKTIHWFKNKYEA